MKKFSKLVGALILFFAAYASAVNINGTEYYFTVSSSSMGGGAVKATISQATSPTAVTTQRDGQDVVNCSSPLAEWGDVAECLNQTFAVPGSNSSNAIELGSDLEFGGYDDAAGACAMPDFKPITLDGSVLTFNGNSDKGYKIKTYATKWMQILSIAYMFMQVFLVMLKITISR